MKVAAKSAVAVDVAVQAAREDFVVRGPEDLVHDLVQGGGRRGGGRARDPLDGLELGDT